MRSKLLTWLHSDKAGQFLRFGIIGCVAAAVHYAIYYVMSFWTGANAAYITGYLVSFVGNFFLTTYFTFRTRPTLKRFVGFSGSHAVNFGLHVVLFNLFLWLGVHRLVIPLLVMGLAMIVQFTILRFVFTPHGKKKELS